MNKKILALIMSGALCISALAGCSESKETTEQAPTEAEVKVNVSVMNAEKRDIEVTGTYTGELVTDDTAMVSSKVTAKIETINVEVSDWVNAGDLLVKLDSSDYEYQLSQAQAAYAQAEAAYNSALTGASNVEGVSEQTKIQLEQAVTSTSMAYENATTNYNRQKELYDMGAISLVAFEAAETAMENAKVAYETAVKNYEVVVNVITPGNAESAQNGVATAEAAMSSASLAAQQARDNIANTKITAPISGYISTKNASIGQFAAAGNPLFVITNPENIEVEIKVTEAIIPYVEVGGKALVTISAASVSDMECYVSSVNPIKDAMTGMYTVRVAVPNEEKKLNVGMIADVTLVTSQSEEDVVTVLSEAVMQENDEYYVYVVTDDTAQKRVVTCGVTDGVYTQIIEGVSEGEIIVTEGKEYLSETNNIVNIVE